MSKKTLGLIAFLAIVSTVILLAFWSYSKTGVSGSPLTTSLEKLSLGGIFQTLKGESKLSIERDTRPISDFLPSIPSPVKDEALEVEERLYQKSAYSSLVVNDVSKYVKGITSYFVSIKGRILSSNINLAGKYESATLVVKVPVERFDEANLRIKEEARKIVSESVSVQDETGAYVSAFREVERLQKEKMEKEKQLLMTSKKTEKGAIELEIKYLDEQINRAYQKVTDVKNRLDYASISLRVSNNERYFSGTSTKEKPDLWEVGQQAFEALRGVLYLIAYFLIWVIVFGVLWLPIVLIARFVFFCRKTGK